MAGDSGSTVSVRAVLNHMALADVCQRAALAERLELTEHEVLAVQHLARAGELTPSELGAKLRLQLSSARTTRLIRRLQRAGYVTRTAHPLDGRSTLLSLTPLVEQFAREACAPLLVQLDKLARELSPSERETVTRFLQRVGNAAEQLARNTDARPQDTLAIPLPTRWA